MKTMSYWNKDRETSRTEYKEMSERNSGIYGLTIFHKGIKTIQ